MENSFLHVLSNLTRRQQVRAGHLMDSDSSQRQTTLHHDVKQDPESLDFCKNPQQPGSIPGQSLRTRGANPSQILSKLFAF